MKTLEFVLQSPRQLRRLFLRRFQQQQSFQMNRKRFLLVVVITEVVVVGGETWWWIMIGIAVTLVCFVLRGCKKRGFKIGTSHYRVWSFELSK